MSAIYLSVFSLVYVLVQAQNTNISKLNIQYNSLVHTNNQTKHLINGSKINFNDFLKSNPLIKKVIDIEKVFEGSDILFLCDSTIPDLTKSADLNLVRKYPRILLCMGLSHALLLNGMIQQQNYSIFLPQSKLNFDNLITNINANNSLKHEVMCKQHKVTLPIIPTYNTGVEEYVNLLNPLLNNETMCLNMCLTFEDTINPMCVLIMEANSAFFKQYNVSPTDKLETLDSARAAELNSDVDTTLSNTKEITEGNFGKNVLVNKGNVAVLTLASNNKSSTPANDTKIVTPVSEPTEEIHAKKNDTSTPSPITTKPDLGAGEVNDENSAENTENADDYMNIETAKQTSPNVLPDATQTKTNPISNKTSEVLEPSQSNSKPVLLEEDKPVLEEDNAQEAAEVEPFNSKQKYIAGEKIIKPEHVDKTEKKTFNKVSTSSKPSEKTVVESKDDFVLNDDQDIPPQQEVVPAPPAQVPNVDTIEGDNILVNGNNNDEPFSSNIDLKQQAADPGDSILDIQENTPYIIAKDGFVEAEDSHFFTYFVFMFVICIVMYVGFYNKRKILALALEGRAGRRTRSRRGTYSRVNTGYDESKEHLLY